MPPSVHGSSRTRSFEGKSSTTSAASSVGCSSSSVTSLVKVVTPPLGSMYITSSAGPATGALRTAAKDPVTRLDRTPRNAPTFRAQHGPRSRRGRCGRCWRGRVLDAIGRDDLGEEADDAADLRSAQPGCPPSLRSGGPTRRAVDLHVDWRRLQHEPDVPGEVWIADVLLRQQLTSTWREEIAYKQYRLGVGTLPEPAGEPAEEPVDVGRAETEPCLDDRTSRCRARFCAEGEQGIAFAGSSFLAVADALDGPPRWEARCQYLEGHFNEFGFLQNHEVGFSGNISGVS